MNKIASLLIVAILLSGCAPTVLRIKTGSESITDENLEKIKKGMDKSEVVAILGKPASVTAMPPLSEFWVYTYSEIEQTHHLNPFQSGTIGGAAKSVSVTFDQDGKVATIGKSVNNLFQPMMIEVGTKET